MKILILTPYYLPRTGGVESVVKQISRMFKKNEHNVKIITRNHDGTLKCREKIEDINVFRIPFQQSKYIWKFWLWLLKNRKYVKESDIVQLHDFTTFFWYLPLKFIYFKKPCFIFFHGYEKYPISTLNKILRKIAEKLTNSHMCVGKYWMMKYYGTRCSNYFFAGIEKTPKIVKKEGKIIFGARLDEDTAILSYLETLKILKTKFGIDVHLDVYGDGKLRNKSEEYARENELNVTFYGDIPNPHLFFPKYKYVFATQYMATIFAMVSKCLVFNLCENELKLDLANEITQNGKFGIVAKCALDMAKKFKKYYKNNNLSRSIINEAFNFARPQTWENLANELLKIYERIID